MSLSPHPQPNINQPPPPSHPSIICNNNTMYMAFQVEMKQYKKSRSVSNDEIINLPSVSIPCLL